MNKTEFYKAVADRTGMTQKDTKTVFETAQEILTETLKADEEVKMFDGVTFSRVYRDAREARNPQTGEVITVEGKYAPKVKIGKVFKEAIA